MIIIMGIESNAVRMKLYTIADWSIGHSFYFSLLTSSKIGRKRKKQWNHFKKCCDYDDTHSICAFHLRNIIPNGLIMCCFVVVPEKKRIPKSDICGAFHLKSVQSNKQENALLTNKMFSIHQVDNGSKAAVHFLLHSTWSRVRAAFVWAYLGGVYLHLRFYLSQII